MKTCKKCNIKKSVEEFSLSKRASDGLWLYCKQCERERMAVRRAENPEKQKAIATEWRAKNPEKVKQIKQRTRAKNIEAHKARRREAYLKNKDVELEKARIWKERNKEYLRAKQYFEYWMDPAAARAKQNVHLDANRDRARLNRMNRIASQKQAIPVWADRDVIAKAYEASDLLMQVTGEWYEVDHIVPLKGCHGRKQVVSGLHVGHNLQVITRAENRAKSNQFWPDMPGKEA